MGKADSTGFYPAILNHVPEVTGNSPPGPGQESIPQKNHLWQVSGDFTVLSYQAITKQDGTGNVPSLTEKPEEKLKVILFARCNKNQITTKSIR